VFVKALQQFEEHPHRIGEIFVQFVSESAYVHMYQQELVC